MDLEEKLVSLVRSGNVDEALDAISSGACLNMPVATETGSETTALLEAVTLENLKISICLTQLLLLNGADPNLEVAGTAALHAAARLGRGDHTTLLLKSGAQLQQKDKQGKTALSIAREHAQENVEKILLGTFGNVTIKFSRYVFEEDSEEKENAVESCATTDFLRQVEQIFSSDIVGTPLCTTQPKSQSPIDADLADVANQLEQAGFRTPNIYRSAGARTVDRSLRGLNRDGYAEKVANFLDNMDAQQSIPESDGNKTPKRHEKSYLRPTASSTMKRRLQLDSSVGQSPRPNMTKEKSLKGSDPSVRVKEVHTKNKSMTPKASSTLKRKIREEANCPEPTDKNTNSYTRNESGSSSQLHIPDHQARFSTLESMVSKNSSISRSSLAVSLANTSNISISEEYIIQDQVTGLELVEKRLPSLLSLALQDEALLNQLEEEAEKPTNTSNNLSLGSMSAYSTGKIKRELGKFGESLDGPITTDTKRAYLLRLKKLRLGLVIPPSQLESKFPEPLAKSLKNISTITKSWENLWKLEEEMSNRFSKIDPKTAADINYLTRESVCKSSFNYLLLDPRKSQNLPYKVFSWADQDLWKIFVDSIFYIGKGTRSRPFQHLYDACKTKVPKKTKAKVQTILDIWEAGHGVVSLQVFNNSISVEGLTREAAMIDALGLDNLSNARPGDYYGPAASWSPQKRLQLGTFLLYRAFKIFLQEGERQIRPVDLKVKI